VTPEQVIDLTRYPIADPKDPRRGELITRLRGELADNQYCVLPGFLTEQARAQAVAEALALRPRAYDNCATRNCYLQRSGRADLPADHPRNLMFAASTRMIACDLIPADSPLKTLYDWPATRAFVAGIVGADALYANEDPYQPVNILCYEAGDRSAWHFDSENAFTMTLTLQGAESGGDFELVPDTRSETNENIDYLRQVLLAQSPADARRVAREPGALCIFRGCNSLHRVSPVAGSQMRIMGVFVYENAPGVTGDPEVNATVYGPRTTA